MEYNGAHILFLILGSVHPVYEGLSDLEHGDPAGPQQEADAVADLQGPRH